MKHIRLFLTFLLGIVILLVTWIPRVISKQVFNYPIDILAWLDEKLPIDIEMYG